jgi:mannosyl-3-phosphoglycerate phosphatase
MKLRAVLTDLDGTLLEPDGSLCEEGAEALRLLGERGVAVLPVTSKTAAEVVVLLERFGLGGPAGFENGAGVIDRHGGIVTNEQAVTVQRLRVIAERLRRSTGAPLRTLEELSECDLAGMTGMAGDDLARARQRQATLPLVVDRAWDVRLRAAAPAEVRLVRGNRFLHLQGQHGKADVVARLLEETDGEGLVVGFGDAPNDLDLLRAADVAVIVPSEAGAHQALREALPDALIAPAPHGRGWARTVRQLLAEISG